MRPLTAFLFPIRLIILVLLSPFVTILHVGLALIIYFPSQLFRKLVSVIGQCLDKDLCKLVQTTASTSARDYADWSSQPSETVCTIIKLRGHFDLPTMQQRILNGSVYRRDPKTRQLEYPELQQYCTKRLGFLFYKWDRKFQIKNHIKMYQSKRLLPDPENCVVDDELLHKIWEDCTLLPFHPKRSPWDFLVIHNYRPNQDKKGVADGEMENGGAYTILILRTVHSLMDGYSTYRFLLTLTDHGTDHLDKEMASRPAPKCFTAMLHLKALFLGPTAMLWSGLKGIDMNHALHIPRNKKVGQPFIATTTLELKVLKKVRKAHLDVSFHSVLIAGLTGGIRTYLIKNGFRIPFRPIRLGIPIPKPGHSRKLRNEFLTSCIELPVHKKTARQRLFACERSLNELKTGAITPFLAQMVTFFGGFPVQCARALTSVSGASIMYSEMKGPEVPLTIFDGKHDLDSLMFSIPLGTDDLGISFSSISYVDKVHFVLVVDKGIAKTREKAQELMYYIEKEMEEMQYGDSTYL